jgi:hypothetical protein
MILPTSDEVDDFHLIAVAEHAGLEGSAFEHGEIEFDGNAPRIDLQT